MKQIIWQSIRILLRLFWILPIKKNRILFFSFSGKQYACNPKYISEYIYNNYSNEFEIIWAFTEVDKYKFLEQKNIKVIPFKSVRFLKFFFTSKVIVTNDSFYPFLEKRKKQYLIQTWHGGGAYKKVGNSTRLYSKRTLQALNFTMQNVDLYLSSCKRFSDLLIRNTFFYKGEILEKGTPRNDFLINREDIKHKVRKYYGIPNDYIIILYAPTFRQGKSNVDYELEYNKLIEIVKQQYNKECIILERLHHKIRDNKINNRNKNNVIDVSQYTDMQELLQEADVLITDYSSCMWDFSLMFKPCFIFATDIKQYTEERDFYTPIKEWPFPIAENNNELIENIINYNKENYINKVKKHHEDLGSYEVGQATKCVVHKIINICSIE